MAQDRDDPSSSHEYDLLDPEIVFTIAIRYVPELISQLEPILEQFPPPTQ